MKTINANTKAAARFFDAYNRSRNTSLWDCYASYSTAKACAERECRAKMYDEGGEDFRILSYNTFGFSCGWMVGDTLRVETPSYSYIIK
jgi:hypothetical protein